MRASIVSYFAAEKSGALVLLAIGLLALFVGIALAVRSGGYRAAALPLVLFALGEIGVGVTVWARTDRQVAALLDGVQRTPGDTARVEIARMEKVRRTFAIVKVAEMVFIAMGVALALGLRRSDLAFALGVGCIAQASALLVFDLIADRRAEGYLAALRVMAG